MLRITKFIQDWSKKVIIANIYVVFNSFQVTFIYVSTVYSPQWPSDVGIIIYIILMYFPQGPSGVGIIYILLMYSPQWPCDVGIIIYVLLMRKLRLRVKWCAWSHRVMLCRGLILEVHCPIYVVKYNPLSLERKSPFMFYVSFFTSFSLIITLWPHFRI